jgi:hypothetical protein
MITTEPGPFMKPSGAPMAVIILNELHFQRISLANLRDDFSIMQADQEKLVELIPLSAAASGMLCGERQLTEQTSRIRETVADSVREALDNSVLPRPQPMQDINNVLGYPRFHWGGRIRHVPSKFRYDYRGVGRQTVWIHWFLWGIL